VVLGTLLLNNVQNNQQAPHSIEPELRQPLPRGVRIEPAYALRQMTRLVVLTVASSLLWTSMARLSAPVPIIGPTPNQHPNAILTALQNYHGLIALLIAVLIGCLVFLWFSVFVETARRYQLVISGGVGQAKIRSRRVALGWDASVLQIEYSFIAPDGTRISGRTDCSLTEWQNADAGAQATVLFAPNNPSNNVLYVLGGFRAA